MTGCINEFTSRRVHYDICVYWNRDDRSIDLEELVHKTKPNGRFYARESGPYNFKKQEIANSFLFDETNLTIETNDTINIKSGDIVKYDGLIWHVLDVQKVEIHKNKQFLKINYATTYLRLKR